MRVALLGTGKMGAAIAARLQGAGHPPVLWNRTLERARALGIGEVRRSAAEAAHGSEVVLSILYGPDSVREVYASLEPERGQVFVEMSTAGGDVLEEVAPRLRDAGAELLAAPILGSLPAIAAGNALVLVGGDRAAFDRAEGVLQAFSQPRHVGSRAQAAGLKLVNNAMLAACNLAAAELLATAAGAGLDQAVTFELLTRLVPYLQLRQRGFLEGIHSPAMFELSGLVKDLDLALTLGSADGAGMPFLQAARDIYAGAATEHGREEMTAVIESYR